jgi:hypothetical protein
MALNLEWGTSEAEQITADHMNRFMRAGVIATYAAFYRDLQTRASARLGVEVRFANALRAELPILAQAYSHEDESVPLPDDQSHLLALAKVDPTTGVRLDRTLMSVAYVAPGDEPGPWQVKKMASDTGFTKLQAELILASAVELSSHGLEIR